MLARALRVASEFKRQSESERQKSLQVTAAFMDIPHTTPRDVVLCSLLLNESGRHQCNEPSRSKIELQFYWLRCGAFMVLLRRFFPGTAAMFR